ncbi:hypothetical protein [Halalkalicoccus jeotgali]|uniref:hypothetical protein n=1 Tax=Halalkalicoccus jeotgali TaxID=413810 RepID=UPI0011D19E5D|nr:hypothetical protein [Halalkalicoccus jeotgali]
MVEVGYGFTPMPSSRNGELMILIHGQVATIVLLSPVIPLGTTIEGGKRNLSQIVSGYMRIRSLYPRF